MMGGHWDKDVQLFDQMNKGYRSTAREKKNADRRACRTSLISASRRFNFGVVFLNSTFGILG